MKKALILASVASMIEQFNMSNIKLLKELGYKVEIATNFENSGTISSKRAEELKQELKNMDVEFYQIDFDRNALSLQNLKAYKQTKKLIQEGKYDIIHLHSPIGGVCGRIAAKKLRKQGTRVIYTAHGFHFYKGAPILNWIIFYPIEKWLAKYTDTLITINQEDYERAKKHFKAKNIELVHGVGIDEKKFDFTMSAEEKKDFREELGVKENDFVITIVGELNKNKNQIMAIEAMKELVLKNQGIKLLLVGKGPLEEEYRRKIKEYSLEKNIILLGYRTDIPKILKVSDLLLSLSYREGLPVNVIEAIMCGLPIIATNCRGNRDLVQDGKNGYIVEIGNSEDLKEKIEQISEKKAKYKTNNDEIEKYKLKNINERVKDLYNGKN